MIELIKTKKKDILTYIGFIILFILCTVNVPYVIEKPGGLINTTDRLDVKENIKTKGSLNMAYVSEIKASIPILIMAKFIPYWDIIKEEDNKGENESLDESLFRGKMALEDANATALQIAYKMADIPLKIEKEEVFVTYIFEEADTTLKVKDQILEINDHKIESKIELSRYTNSLKKGEIVNLKVLNNNKEEFRKAKIIEVNDIRVIGILTSSKIDYDKENNIKLKYTEKESGSSGGLMTTLAIYQELIKKDITLGRKIAGTGTIKIDGSVGAIDGVKFKLRGAVNNNADVFLIPEDNYNEAIKEKKKNNYKIDIVKVKNIKDAIEYLKK